MASLQREVKAAFRRVGIDLDDSAFRDVADEAENFREYFEVKILGATVIVGVLKRNGRLVWSIYDVGPPVDNGADRNRDGFDTMVGEVLARSIGAELDRLQIHHDGVTAYGEPLGCVQIERWGMAVQHRDAGNLLAKLRAATSPTRARLFMFEHAVVEVQEAG